MPNSTLVASSEFDAEQWTGWMYDLPLAAERFSGWKIHEDIHLCPTCFGELSYGCDRGDD